MFSILTLTDTALKDPTQSDFFFLLNSKWLNYNRKKVLLLSSPLTVAQS